MPTCYRPLPEFVATTYMSQHTCTSSLTHPWPHPSSWPESRQANLPAAGPRRLSGSPFNLSPCSCESYPRQEDYPDRTPRVRMAAVIVCAAIVCSVEHAEEVEAVPNIPHGAASQGPAAATHSDGALFVRKIATWPSPCAWPSKPVRHFQAAMRCRRTTSLGELARLREPTRANSAVTPGSHCVHPGTVNKLAMSLGPTLVQLEGSAAATCIHDSTVLLCRRPIGPIIFRSDGLVPVTTPCPLNPR